MLPVTVLLRTLDAEPYLPALLDRLAGQEGPPSELLVVDSGSRDRTVELCEAAGGRVVRMDPARFTHARSTNLGFREARGEIVAMLSQDALPMDATWLDRLVRPLGEAGTVAAFGRQVARPGCFPLERWELERCYPAAGPPGVLHSNVNSATLRREWLSHPFDETLLIAEDRAWAEEATARGGRIAYAPGAAVLHSHAYTLRAVYRRCREEARALRARSGRREGAGLLIRGWPAQTLGDARRLGREGAIGTWPRAAAYRLAQFAGMIAGGRS